MLTAAKNLVIIFPKECSIMYDVIIIGGGIAGLTAAVYARRANLTALVLEGVVCGGQIINSPEVDNYPARPHVSGVELITDVQKQAEEFGAEIVYAHAESYDLTGPVKRVVTNKGEYEGKAVIIANGANHRKLTCPGVDQFSGRGVSYCATCDGAFFRNRAVAVVGGGNTAFEDAIFLAGLCSKVYLVNRRAQFRAEPKLVRQLESRENAVIMTPYVPEEIVGDKRVSGFKVKNTETGEVTELPVSGVFTAVGMIPDNGAFKDILTLDEGGYIVTDDNCKTSVPGVFAAGDTRSKTLRQLVTAAADGALAASAAASYINDME